ncbi:MAG: hypothetical protein ACRBCT_05075 [Alphaproteobacteria bacterium]
MQQLKNKTETILAAFEEHGFDTTLTANKAVKKFINSIPQFSLQDAILHDLCHIFANAVYGSMEEEDPTFILQAQLYGECLDHAVNDSEQYRETRELLQQRALIIQDFFNTLTGIKNITQIPSDALGKIPLCMFGIVSDTKPLRPTTTKFPYRLMSNLEREQILSTLAQIDAENALGIRPIGHALTQAPERIEILESRL